MTNQTHSAVIGSERVPLPGARAKGATNPHAQLDVVLKLRRKADLPMLADRPAVQLTRGQLAEHVGASDGDVQAVTRALKAQGLTIVDANAATRSVEVTGTAAQMEKAFQVKLFDYAHPDGDYRGRVGPVRVPAEIADKVTGVFGLDNRRVAYRRRKRPHDLDVHAAHALPPSWYKPSELAQRYNFPEGTGSGQTIGILEFGGGYFEDDLKQFCQLAGTAFPKVTVVSVDGTPTDARDGAEGEVMLDIEVVAGVCPEAHIVGYFARFTERGWIKILDEVIRDEANDPSVLSISWGYAEDADIWTRQAMVEVDKSLADAALLGITVCVAAGDDGSSDGVTDGHAHADFPATSPHALAVGGTTIPGKNTPDPDICWFEGDGLRSDQGGATGGGVSAVFPRPGWQNGIAIDSVNPSAIRGRCIPDLAANADWNASPYLLVVDGGPQPNGGTSAATPLIASLIVLINEKRGAGKRIGYLTPLLYQAAAGGTTLGGSACRDVVSGGNATAAVGGYKAGPGYDAVSGWGTPDGGKLLAAAAGATAASPAAPQPAQAAPPSETLITSEPIPS